MSADPRDAEKKLAAEAATALVEPGMLVGLGTGTTAAHVIAALAARVADGLAIRVVGTSLATEQAARAAGLDLQDFSGVPQVDLTIDGVDEIDPTFRAIKGGGGAMLREKIVAEASAVMVAIADGSKTVSRLQRPVPVEVLPFAEAFVLRRLGEMGAEPRVRTQGGAPVLSDGGNLLVDAAFGSVDDPEALAASLAAVPGLIGHGLFLREIDRALIARGDHVERLERETKPGS